MWKACLVCGGLWAASAFAAQAQTAPAPTNTLPDTAILDQSALAAETVVLPTTIIAAQSTQTLTAGNSGNTVQAETVQTGDIALGADAFSGFNGIGNFIMNTGNNNNVQGAISVVVVMGPP